MSIVSSDDFFLFTLPFRTVPGPRIPPGLRRSLSFLACAGVVFFALSRQSFPFAPRFVDRGRLISCFPHLSGGPRFFAVALFFDLRQHGVILCIKEYIFDL